MISTPNLDKMLSVKPDSQTIGQFLEWIGEQGWEICEWCEGEKRGDEDVLLPLHMSIEKMLALYFDVNLQACEAEREAVLKNLRGEQ